MSNIGQFFSKGFPLGGVVSICYNGDVYTAPDGSQWYSNTPTAPFDYTSEYGNLPEMLTSPHPIMNGPESTNLFHPYTTSLNIAYNKTGNVLVTSAYSGAASATVGFKYYRSTDGGDNWTEYTFPNPTLTYQTIQYTAGKFIAHNAGATANSIIWSTDGITWSNATPSASITSQDIVSDNGNIILIVGNSSSHQISTDGGNTWAAITTPSPVNNGTLIGCGVVTYNQGANLFITAAGTVGTYMTAAPGQPWTSNTNNSTYATYGSKLYTSVRMASNATITVAMGMAGYFCTTTDSNTWSNHGFISTTMGTTLNPNQFYYDGEKWVARFAHRVFYSYDSVTWTEGKKIGGFTTIIPQSNGLLFGFPLLSTNNPTKCLRVANVADTTPKTVISSVLAVAQGTNMTQYRIK